MDVFAMTRCATTSEVDFYSDFCRRQQKKRMSIEIQF